MTGMNGGVIGCDETSEGGKVGRLPLDRAVTSGTLVSLSLETCGVMTTYVEQSGRKMASE